ncbi:MAG TPA: Asp-tRNA(Asn)/Glu-tRNA(Gln) amidotransferase subunit GatC [Blastocatellia bacterium]|jgi:aspartyl-tRNA(Asn)/glutamyl-tRNA(Gln) amidotransferase subunit C|nr:Asp-tRNA(Asn)/Glu-tRNA(Gln) amidotransferase subunit GatC [Blastocatellia bacterium]
MPITRSEVEKIAELARLELTSDETEAFTEQLGAIIGHIDKLNELQSDEMAPVSHCTPALDTEYVLRDDVVRPGPGSQAATECAPDAEAGYFKVPKVIGG